MQNRHLLFLAGVFSLAASTSITAESVADGPADVILAKDGRAALPIVAGEAAQPAEELRRYLNRIIGADGDFAFEVVPRAEHDRRRAAIFVGTFEEFPQLAVNDFASLGSEGFIVRPQAGSVFLLANRERGVSHAVMTLLKHLGCRWYFPGERWEVVPSRKNLRIALDVREVPSFPTQRRIWYGYGAYAQNKQEWEDWMRRNRMGAAVPISIGHAWAGLKSEADFKTHPEYFALVDGKRLPTKPCYSHPDVIARAIAAAKRRAEEGAGMISMTPPDGLGYCECDRCLKTAKVRETFQEHRSLFGKQPDGRLVNVTSETVFQFVNQVAAAVAEGHPRTLIGCYAYSAYSHPPSFDLHKNVYLQTTTAYRRTPLTLQQQLAAYGAKTEQLGIREYYSVYQWDWDYPDPGKLTPDALRRDLKFFHDHGVTAVNAEASCNWGPRGLGYYLAANLMWNINAETDPLVRDFLQTAFGPAAPAMQRYFARWYGEEVAVLSDADDLPAKTTYRVKNTLNLQALIDAYGDLDEAVRLTDNHPAERVRVDQFRMYAHYLLLRYKLQVASEGGDNAAVLEAIEQETRFGGRIAATNMIHTRPLVGKAFLRRFRSYEKLLADQPAAAQSGKGWRQIGNPPDAEELRRIWREDLDCLNRVSKR